MAYDNPGGQNNFRYKIGWNLDANGIASSWSFLTMVDGLGWEGQGAGIAIHNLDGNSQPERGRLREGAESYAKEPPIGILL